MFPALLATLALLKACFAMLNTRCERKQVREALDWSCCFVIAGYI